MAERTIICTVCPMGCSMTVKADGDDIVSVEGNECPRGEDFARDEYTCPTRTLTSSVLISGSKEPLLPVRTEKPVPKAKFNECMEAIKLVRVKPPVKMHQVIIHDLAGTGIDLIATCRRDVE